MVTVNREGFTALSTFDLELTRQQDQSRRRYWPPTQASLIVLDASVYVVDELPGPNVADKESVLGMARIAANSYVLDDDDPEWVPVGGSFNYTDDFGWDNDGLRGYAFADENNMTVIVKEFYCNVTEIYPNAEIWLASHSLGKKPRRTNLQPTCRDLRSTRPDNGSNPPRPPITTRLQLGFSLSAPTRGYHFGHTADPIFMVAGYAMQSVRHSGMTCTYDTVQDFGCRSGVGSHQIRVVIKDVLEKYDMPANCKSIVNCTDCFY